MLRSYKLFKISANREKLVKEFDTMQEATYKVRSILGLREFQKCKCEKLSDGNTTTGLEFSIEGKKIFVIRKEIIWDHE